MLGAIFGFILGFLLSILLAVLAFFGLSSASLDTGDWSSFDSGTVVEEASIAPLLVDPYWVNSESAFNSNLVIADVATVSDFEAGHIPGAVRIDPSSISISSTEDIDWQSSAETLLEDAGISVESTVVIYDRGTQYAAPFWWTMTRLGHGSVAVLDGGFSAWESAGWPVETGPSTAAIEVTFYFGWLDQSLVASTSDVEAAIDDPTIVILDVRTAAEYATSHIPGAVNVPVLDLFAADGTMLPMSELEAVFEAAGVTPDMEIIVYCQTGIRASNGVFALNVLGYPDVKLYADSWSGWSSDPTHPVEP